ncbi:MAG: ATP-binding SpoIIE family protein phosphatase [Brevinema sp.]
MRILTTVLIGILFFLIISHQYLVAIGFIIGILCSVLFFWLWNYLKKHRNLFSFTSNIFHQILATDSIESLRTNVLSYIKELKDYQIFLLTHNKVLTFPARTSGITKEEKKVLEYYAQQSLRGPYRIGLGHTFCPLENKEMDCYAYSYSIPFFNKRLLILAYISPSIVWTPLLQEQIKAVNDTLMVFTFLGEAASGHRGVFKVLKETVWESPYAMALCNPLGELDFGNDSLYQMFQGDIPNFVDFIGKEVFLMLLDGKRIGQSFMLQGRRIRLEAFPINNRNFLVTKCFLVFSDEQMEFKRELLGESNTLKRFTSGSSIVGAAMFTQEGIILYSNEAFMKSLDVYKVREATQKNIFELFDISEELYQQIVHQILLGQEQCAVLTSKDNDEELQVCFKGIVFGDKTIIEVVLEDNTIYHDNMAYLDKETQILYEELKTARSIQEHILTLPTIYRPGVYINTLYKPAHQLSGDFFTVIPLPNDQMGILIADVSGHGISASLITAALKILIEFVPSDAGSIPKVMSYFNTYLAEILPEGSFVTLFYGIINFRENTLQYINSGHPFPLMDDIDKNEVKILEGMGYPLGGLLNVSFEDLVYTIQLPEKCKIILYTDGILQHLLGTMKEKLSEMRHIIQTNKAVNDKVLLNNLYTAFVHRNTSQPEDDVSMMMISIDRSCTNKHHLYISSSLLEVDTVIEQICSYIQKTAALDSSVYWKIRTCFYESLLNAVAHGNKYNTQKKVYIEFRISGSLIVIRVRDEGVGFDYQTIADPFSTENILKDFGRGITMIKTLADRIKLNRKGNEMTMFFKIDEKKDGEK